MTPQARPRQAELKMSVARDFSAAEPAPAPAPATSAKPGTGMVAVRWDVPGNPYHGVVHYVPVGLVDSVGGDRVVVWWPSRKGKKLAGTRVNEVEAGTFLLLQC